MAEDEPWMPLSAMSSFGAQLCGAAASALVTRWHAGHAPTLTALRSRLARHGVLALRPEAGGRSGDYDATCILGLAAQLGRPRPLPRSTWVAADGTSRAQPLAAERAAAPAAPLALPQSAVLRVIRNAEDTTVHIFGEQWHTDGSFMAQPPELTLWRAVDIPNVAGGRTLFASMDAFLEAGLPPAVGAELQRCYAVHASINQRLLPRGSEGAAEGASRCRRPALGRHPADGRSYVDVCDGFTEELRAMASLEEGEGDLPSAAPADAPSTAALLSRVLDALHSWSGAAPSPAGVADWHWQAGDVVLLDNLRCVHRATGGVEGHRRELERVLIDECWACA